MAEPLRATVIQSPQRHAAQSPCENAVEGDTSAKTGEIRWLPWLENSAVAVAVLVGFVSGFGSTSDRSEQPKPRQSKGRVVLTQWRFTKSSPTTCLASLQAPQGALAEAAPVIQDDDSDYLMSSPEGQGSH